MGVQELLPGFSVMQVPMRDAEYLKAQKQDGDYYIEITEAGLAKITGQKRHWSGTYSYFEPLTVPVDSADPRNETLQFRATRDARLLWAPGIGRRDVVVKPDQEGIFVAVFIGALRELEDGSRDFLTDRYDGHTNKIWIRKEF